MRQMKNSGIEWVGDIPDSWKIERMKSCIISREGGAWGDEETGYNDTICLRIADFDYDRFVFKDTAISELTKRHYGKNTILKLKLIKGDILIEKSGGGEKTPVGRTVIFDKEYLAVFANFMDRLRCREFVYPKFMQYIFVTFYKNQYTRNYIKQTTGIQNLDLSLMLNKEHVPVPPVEEQKRIAGFLDKKCGEIDGLISDIKTQVQTLEQYKRSVITEAVTKGLNPSAEMKDSGIQWIGNVPAEWTINKIDSVYSLRNEKVSDKDYMPLSVTMKGIVPQLESAAKTNDGDNRKLVRKGDFAINSRSDRRGSCGISELDGSVSLINLVLKPRGEMNNRYYNWLFHTEKFADEFYKWGHGIVDDLWTTRWIDMRKISVPMPPLSEQKEIADYLDNKCAQIEELISAKQSQIETLESYKKSLIYEYVTGKKEVA